MLKKIHLNQKKFKCNACKEKAIIESANKNTNLLQHVFLHNQDWEKLIKDGLKTNGNICEKNMFKKRQESFCWFEQLVMIDDPFSFVEKKINRK